MRIEPGAAPSDKHNRTPFQPTRGENQTNNRMKWQLNGVAKLREYRKHEAAERKDTAEDKTYNGGEEKYHGGEESIQQRRRKHTAAEKKTYNSGEENI